MTAIAARPTAVSPAPLSGVELRGQPAGVQPARETRHPRTVQNDGYTQGGSPEARRFAQAGPQGLQEPGVNFPAPLKADATARQRQAYGYQSALVAYDQGHVQGRPIPDSALAGMNGLKAHDPELNFRRDGDRVVMSRGDRQLETFRAPRDNDYVGWSRTMQQAGEAAGDHNPRIRRLGADAIYNSMQTGMANGLDPHTRFVPQRELDQQQRTVI